MHILQILTVVILPNVLKGVVVLGVTVAATALFNLLVLKAPWLADFLGPYKDQAVAVVAGAIIAFVEAQLNLFPQYEVLINGALAFLVIVVGFFGIPYLAFKFAQRKGVRAFRAVNFG